MIPAGEPVVMEVQFVSPDGRVEDGPALACRAVEGAAWGKAAVRGGCQFVDTDNN
jgi:hypothetical protein